MMAELETALAHLRDLQKAYQIVATKTGELHSACESISLEQVRCCLSPTPHPLFFSL